MRLAGNNSGEATTQISNILHEAMRHMPGKRVSKGATIRVSFDAKDSAKMSPLWLDILRNIKKDDWGTELSVSLPISSGTNAIEIEVNASAGTYQLQAGYFLKEELTREYPNYYAEVCRFDVIS